MDEKIITLYLDLVAETIRQSSSLIDSDEPHPDGLSRSAIFRDDFLSVLENWTRELEVSLTPDESETLRQLQEVLSKRL